MIQYNLYMKEKNVTRLIVRLHWLNRQTVTLTVMFVYVTCRHLGISLAEAVSNQKSSLWWHRGCPRDGLFKGPFEMHSIRNLIKRSSGQKDWTQMGLDFHHVRATQKQLIRTINYKNLPHEMWTNMFQSSQEDGALLICTDQLLHLHIKHSSCLPAENQCSVTSVTFYMALADTAYIKLQQWQ